MLMAMMKVGHMGMTMHQRKMSVQMGMQLLS